MGFDGITQAGQQSILISVDDSNTIAESNKANNTATAYFNVNNNGTYNPTYPNTTFTGRADLAIRIAEAGVVDRNTGVFTARTVIYSNEKSAVRFEVMNRGGLPSGYWTWTATLPTNTGSNYQAPLQNSIEPGGRMEFVVSFDNTQNYSTGYNYSAPVSIRIDSDNRVLENDESNNYITTYVPISYNNYDPYNYNSGSIYNGYNGNQYNNNYLYNGSNCSNPSFYNGQYYCNQY